MRVSVVVPALDEGETVGGVVKQARASGADEVLVIDSDSRDDTAQRAAEAGATVVNWRDIDPQPVRPGKGEALWRGVKAASGDVVVFLDADVTTVEPWWVDTLAAPLEDPAIHLVKAAYRRANDGGRVTELTAKPLLRLFFPDVPQLDQPLAGEYAIRRETALRLPFAAGYGVEAGLLIDVTTHHGPASITQVDLGLKTHRNRPLTELTQMSETVARAILSRAGVLAPHAERPPWVR
ncbi:glucosyl-3-phosphoglycerate synthase [Corynebacterium sp. CCUG 71335]|uniref:glucosyl-3-phosphoglycerate synthase n=1 Tax=unclassified Corynebacterium TaxID=2624378 RepID=UPI00210A587C|nr:MULTISPECIES: glucosyl-3-phosphoglycerate synthase [unclassified Corynebacterium]MCQ4619668.1 glucosyl-3-phosphoglycerate synthase [Corynebacterium sp. CCUG 71335]MCQ4625170.1 glucosyl-3-phosphoglycerate synthase [Corynebacterium sp. CCUG 69979]